MLVRVTKIVLLLCGLGTGILFVFMLTMPDDILKAALKGISIWWEVLFPALFPFFVTAELMLGFGIVHFLGTCFDPVMRPLFRVPGIGGFVFAMGFAAGYPIAAKLTSNLCEQGLLTREEGERLVAFTSTSDPIFLLGAVSIGFFHQPSLAIILAVAHYGSAIILGLLMRYHAGGIQSSKAMPEPSSPLWRRALKAMHEARIQDGRPVGLLLKDAVQASIQLVLVVGSLVVFFSVLIEVCSQLNVLAIINTGIASFLSVIGLARGLSEAISNGIFEVTLGAKAAGMQAQSADLKQSAAIAAFILSWSGLSVHAQIISIMSRAKLRYTPFLLARLFHACMATIAVLVIWPWLNEF